jgi:Rad4 beta-hairpin domain 3/Rad4 beta-hairpin domain 1/Rad4 transglutaminase-like domain
MSFDWNLSSDEEETFDEWTALDTLKTSQEQRGAVSSSSVHQELDEAGDSSSSENEDHPRSSSHFSGIAFGPADEAEEEEVEDDVDWEDADMQLDGSGADHTSEKLASDTNKSYDAVIPNLRPVTLNLNQSVDRKDDTKTTKKRLSRKRFRYEQLTPDLQYLLSNLEKAHLLSLTATAMIVSNHCSREETLAIAHSLIPLAWMQNPTSTPTMHDLRSFCSFFFHLIHPTTHLAADAVARRPPNWKRKSKKKTMVLSQQSPERPRVGGQFAAIQFRTEEYASFLSTRLQPDSIPSRLVQEEGGYHQYDEVQLFVSMARSLGWRTRFVMALEPCQRDLDPDHPLFVAMSTRNVFQRLWKDSKRDDSKRPAKRSRKGMETIDQNLPESDNMAMRSMPKPFGTDMTINDLPPCWVEVLCLTAASKRKNVCSSKLQWIHIDPTRELINAPDSIEVALHAKHEGIAFAKTKKKRSIVYALAAEHLSMADQSVKIRLSDVTPRYASSFVDSLKARGVVRGKSGPLRDELRTDKWWVTVLKSVNTSSHARRQQLRNEGRTRAKPIALDEDSDDGGGKPAAVDAGMKEVDEHEAKQFQESKRNEPIPTSKTAFKSNPVYTLPSLLNSNEVLKPDAKQRICGLFKGEFVFRRSDVETALPARRWLYLGFKVKETELSTPILRVKKRTTKGDSKSFKALKSYGVGQSNDGSEETRGKIIDEASKALPDGMENLYASWQTEPWTPRLVGPNDPIPANEYNNIELALLNPGLVHIDERHVAKVAKKLGIPYAPCLLGFEGNGGNRTPTIRGIVVHQHNEEILREANEEMAGHFLQEEHENRQRAILLCWKRLMVGVLTKKRLDQAYG